MLDISTVYDQYKLDTTTREWGGIVSGWKEHPALATPQALQHNMNDPGQCAEGNQPGGIEIETQEQEEAPQFDEEGEGIPDGGGGELNGDPNISPSKASLT